MVITSTAIGFSLLSIGLALCGWRFYKAYKKSENKKVASILVLFILISSLQNGLMGIGSFFLSNNSNALLILLLISNLLLYTHAMVGIFCVYYFFFPKLNPHFSFLLVSIVGFSSMVFLIRNPQFPFLTANNYIDWNMSLYASLSVFYLLFISIGSFLYIFFSLARQSTNLELQIISYLFSLAAFGGIISSFLDIIFFYNKTNDFIPNILDIGVGIIGFIFILVILFVPFIKKRLLV